MSDYEDIVYGECRTGDRLADTTCLHYIGEVLETVQDAEEAVLQIRGLLDARAAGPAKRMEALNVDVGE